MVVVESRLSGSTSLSPSLIISLFPLLRCTEGMISTIIGDKEEEEEQAMRSCHPSNRNKPHTTTSEADDDDDDALCDQVCNRVGAGNGAVVGA